MEEFTKLGTAIISYWKDHNGTWHDVDSLFLGEVMWFRGIPWIVVDSKPVIDNCVQISLASKYVLADCPFKIDDIGVDADLDIVVDRVSESPVLYSESIPAKWCKQIDIALGGIITERITKVIDEETNTWVHLPTEKQLTGDWKYFKNPNNRIGRYAGMRDRFEYWSATMKDNVSDQFMPSHVDVFGTVQTGMRPNYPLGFRPTFTVKFNKTINFGKSG